MTALHVTFQNVRFLIYNQKSTIWKCKLHGSWGCLLKCYHPFFKLSPFYSFLSLLDFLPLLYFVKGVFLTLFRLAFRVSHLPFCKLGHNLPDGCFRLSLKWGYNLLQIQSSAVVWILYAANSSFSNSFNPKTNLCMKMN